MLQGATRCYYYYVSLLCFGGLILFSIKDKESVGNEISHCMEICMDFVPDVSASERTRLEDCI